MKRIRLISKAAIALCAIIALSFFVGEANAQTGTSPQWVLHSQKDGVKIYYSVYRCVPSNMVVAATQSTNPSQLIPTKLLLKFENLDSSTKTVTWNANSSVNNSVQLQSLNLLGLGTQLVDCSAATEIKLKNSNNLNASTSLSEVLGNLNVTISSTTSTN